METKTYEELKELKKNGKISWVEFIMQSEYADKYVEWLRGRGDKPDEDNAELFFDMTDLDISES